MRDNAQRELLGRDASHRAQPGHLSQHSPASAPGSHAPGPVLAQAGQNAKAASGMGTSAVGNAASGSAGGGPQRLPFSIDALRRCLRHGDHARAEKLLDKILLSQLAELIEELTPIEVRALCDLLFAPSRVVRTLDELSRPHVAVLLKHLDDGRLVELLGHLHGSHVARVMALLPSERRTGLRRQLQAQADAFARQMRPVSSVMNTGVPSFGPESTVGEVREALQARTDFEQLYVLDAAQQLLGTISRARLAQAAVDMRLGSLLEPRAGFIARAFTPLHVALKQMRKKALSALPVLDSQGRLLGELRLGGASGDAPGLSSSSVESLREVAGWRRLFNWLTLALVLIGAGQLASVLL